MILKIWFQYWISFDYIINLGKIGQKLAASRISGHEKMHAKQTTDDQMP